MRLLDLLARYVAVRAMPDQHPVDVGALRVAAYGTGPRHYWFLKEAIMPMALSFTTPLNRK